MQDSRRNSIITRVKLASKVGPVTKLMAKITGAPVRGVGNTIGSLVAGRKAAGGIHKGKRLQFAGRKDINVGEYSALKRKAREAGGLPALHEVRHAQDGPAPRRAGCLLAKYLVGLAPPGARASGV